MKHPDQFTYRDIQFPTRLKINYPRPSQAVSPQPNPYVQYNYDLALRRYAKESPVQFKVKHQ